MSDYSFMKSGFNMVDNGDQEDMEQNVTVLIATFMTEGVKHAARYVDHHKTRDVITPEDIKRGMMLEVFLFNNRPDLLEKTDEIKKLIYEDEEDEEDEEEEEEDDEEEDDEEARFLAHEDEENIKFSENGCDCAICKCLNTIYTRWEKWTPNSPFETIIKRNIDKIDFSK